VPQFDRLPTVGMASIIALHIRGLGENPYDVLRQVADYYFDVPSTALPEVLRVLEEINYVQLISKSPTSIQKVIPQVPAHGQGRAVADLVGGCLASRRCGAPSLALALATALRSWLDNLRARRSAGTIPWRLTRLNAFLATHSPDGSTLCGLAPALRQPVVASFQRNAAIG
jgi:hypothetical protein